MGESENEYRTKAKGMLSGRHYCTKTKQRAVPLSFPDQLNFITLLTFS